MTPLRDPRIKSYDTPPSFRGTAVALYRDMQRTRISALILVFSLAACAPSTSFQHVNVAYQPSANLNAPEKRLAPSAVTFAESDADAIKQAGGIYLGELELRGSRGAMEAQQSGPTNLVGRASLEAAERGATHFMLLSGDTHIESHATSGVAFTPNGPAPTVSSTSEQIVVARFALMRVEPEHWKDLRVTLRPEPLQPS
jgi:hypothetical protein